MRLVDEPFAIVITRLTVVRRQTSLIQDLPEWSYSLTLISCLPAPAVEAGCLVDVVGIICGVSDIEAFDLPNRGGVLIKRHVHRRDLSGHEIKVVLWGNCALRFKENAIRALGQTESVVAIFVGTTVQQEYDGERSLAGMAACSWYINEDIVDINKLRSSLKGAFQPIANAPKPHILSRRTHLGIDWPRKHIDQLAVFNVFENKGFKFRCTVTLSRINSRKKWWYTGCELCHRIAAPAFSTYADRFCPSTAADIVYCLSVIALDQTGEAEFTLFGALAEQVIGVNIRRVIRNNQPAGPPIANDTIAASRVEAAFPRARRLSSADTVIPATSWDIDPPMVNPFDPAQNASAVDPGPSNQIIADRESRSTPLTRNDDASAGCSTQVLPDTGTSSTPLLDSTIIAFNRRNHRLVLDRTMTSQDLPDTASPSCASSTNSELLAFAQVEPRIVTMPYRVLLDLILEDLQLPKTEYHLEINEDSDIRMTIILKASML